MLELDDSNCFFLSDVGKEWAQRIHWQPEALEPRRTASDELIAVPVEPETVVGQYVRIHLTYAKKSRNADIFRSR